MFKQEVRSFQNLNDSPANKVDHCSMYAFTIQSMNTKKAKQPEATDSQDKVLQMRVKISKRKQMIGFYRQELFRRQERQRRQIESRIMEREEEVKKIKDLIEQQKYQNAFGFMSQAIDNSQSHICQVDLAERDQIEDGSLLKYLSIQ